MKIYYKFRKKDSWNETKWFGYYSDSWKFIQEIYDKTKLPEGCLYLKLVNKRNAEEGD